MLISLKSWLKEVLLFFFYLFALFCQLAPKFWKYFSILTCITLSRPRSCKRSKTLFKSLLFWLAGEVSWLAVEVISPCKKIKVRFLKQSIAPFNRPWSRLTMSSKSDFGDLDIRVILIWNMACGLSIKDILYNRHL